MRTNCDCGDYCEWCRPDLVYGKEAAKTAPPMVVIDSLIRDLLNPLIPVSMHVEAIHSAARLLPLPSEQYDETIR